MMASGGAALLKCLVLLSSLNTCSTWFYYGDLSWQRDPGSSSLIHFTLNTAWDRNGLQTRFSRVSVEEDVDEFNAEWAAGIAMGSGGLLNVTVGNSDAVRRTIYFTGLGPGNQELQTNNSRFNFIITRLDSEAVYATLRFSKVYPRNGTYNVIFEGCCRSYLADNNQGNAWHLKTTVNVLGYDSTASPVLQLPAFMSLRAPEQGLTTDFDLGAAGGSVQYRVGSNLEMGYGFETNHGGPWNSTEYFAANGLELSTNGRLSLRNLQTCIDPQNCILQMTIILSNANGAAAVDFMVRIVRLEQPEIKYTGFLVTPPSSVHSPVIIQCNSSDFFPPTRTTYIVSECVDLPQVESFECSGLSGICPSAEYESVPPYDLPVYKNCFTANRCQGGKRRLYCTDLAEHGVASSFLRVAFDSGSHQVDLIRQVNEFPTGVVIVPACDGLGNCNGAVLTPDSGAKFVDITWRPDCSDYRQLGTHALCFVAESSNGTDSAPSCIYAHVQGVSSSTRTDLANVVLESTGSITVEDTNPTTGISDHQPPGLRMQVYRQAAHALAYESFLVQPQIAFVDEFGSFSSLSQAQCVFAEIGMDANPVGSSLSGNTKADVVNGLAVFTDLRIDSQGHGFTLRISSDVAGVDVIETPRFTVLPAVRQLMVGTQPLSSVTSGQSLNLAANSPPRIYLFDQDGNFAALSSKVVTVALERCESSPCESSTSKLHGITRVSANEGIALFYNLSVTKVGRYRLRFSSETLEPQISSVASMEFTVTTGLATFVMIDQQPCALPCFDSTVSTQIAKDQFRTAVTITDSFYNPISDKKYEVVASLNRFSTSAHSHNLLCCSQNLPDCVGACNTTMSNGVASFSDLSVQEQGFFSLSFTVMVPHLSAGISNNSIVFDVQLPVNEVRIKVQPGVTIAGETVQGAQGADLLVELLDEYDFRTDSRRPVTMELNSSNATFNCASTCLNSTACILIPNTTCQQPAELLGLASFNAVGGVVSTGPGTPDRAIRINRAGTGYTIKVSASGSVFAMTAQFQVTHAAPDGVVVIRQPLDVSLGQPFGVQPMVAVVDQYGNLASSVTGVIGAFLVAGQDSIFLTGLVRTHLSEGVASFYNLILESTELVSHSMSHQIRFQWSNYPNLTALSSQFVCLPSASNLTVVVEPQTVRAGQNLDGPPTASFVPADGRPLPSTSLMPVAIRLDESDCPERFPPAQELPPQLTQFELQGHLPLGKGQSFVVTNFRTVGVSSQTDFNLTIIDSGSYCNLSTALRLAGGESQSVSCYPDNSCSASSGAFILFRITEIPPSGKIRFCAVTGSNPHTEVGFVLQRGVTAQLHTVLPLVSKEPESYISTSRPSPLDSDWLWYAGTAIDPVDSCNGFVSSKSDPRLAFVLSRGGTFDPSLDYQCPQHPLTLMPYRWATSTEVAGWSTVFNGLGSASLAYTDQCGTAAKVLQDGRNRFIFRDTATSGVYAILGQSENQTLSIGTVAGVTVAGLICVLDDPRLPCSTDCPDVPCPESQMESNLTSVQESQNLLMQLVYYSKQGVSPELETQLLPEHGNEIIMLPGEVVGIRFSLQTEPVTWVTVRASTSTDPALVVWDADTEWRFGAPQWHLGSANSFNAPQTHNITAVGGTSWPLNTTIFVRYTIYSTAPTYNGTSRLLRLRRAPGSVSEAVDYYSQDPDSPLGVAGTLPADPTPAPAIQSPLGLFCVREGAHWPLGAESPSVALTGTVNWCGGEVQHIVTGGFHTCAVMQAASSDKNIYCWGRNDSLQSAVPGNFRVNGDDEDVISLGTAHTCAVSAEGSLACWGLDERGILAVPTLPEPGDKWRSVSCGGSHSCGLNLNGTAYCWGDGRDGQTSVPADSQYLSISCGGSHTCAIGVDSLGICWGSNTFQQSLVPYQSEFRWRQISSGSRHSCGVLVNMSAFCWGDNSFGQSDIPDTGSLLWTHISAGTEHSCGILTDGTMRCWGSPANGRVAILPSADGPWQTVTVASVHSCGLYVSGRISCWGSSDDSKLAVSAVYKVDYDPPGPRAFEPGQGAPMTVDRTGFVDVHLDVNTLSYATNEKPSIVYRVLGDTLPGTEQTYQTGSAVRLDISATIQATAVSNDIQLADSEIALQGYQLTASDPKISPPDVTTGLEYETEVYVNISADPDFNPFSDTKIHLTIHNGDPTVPSTVYAGPILVGNNTADRNGTTRIAAIAVRAGALNSSQVDATYVTRAAPPLFRGAANFTERNTVSDGRGLNISLAGKTPDADIYYTVCRPSSCQGTLYPDLNSQAYTGPFYINETNTTLRAVSGKPFLATSFVSEFIFVLKLRPPQVFPAANSDGYLSPLSFRMVCSDLSTPFYSTDGSSPTIEYTDVVFLTDDVTIRAVCKRAFMDTSDEIVVEYQISNFEVLRANLTESTKLQGALNRITCKLATNRVLSPGTQVTLSGLIGTQTNDNQDFPLSNPRLTAEWQRASGRLVANVTQPLTAGSLPFATTSAAACAEKLPFGSVQDPLGGGAYLSTFNFDVVHKGWKQVWTIDGQIKLTVEYLFAKRCTLGERLTGTGGIACHEVDWNVTDHTQGTSTLLSGSYYFSDSEQTQQTLDQGAGCCAAADDGAWGAVNGRMEANGRRSDSFWGQGNFDSQDGSPGQCDSLYFGSDQDGNPIFLTSPTLRSEVYLTGIDSELSFTFDVTNPQANQSAPIVNVSLSGLYRDILGLKQQFAGPVPMFGNILTATKSFGLSQTVMNQSSFAIGAENVVSFSFLTNLPIPDQSSITVSNLAAGPPLDREGNIFVGVSNIPERSDKLFHCRGLKSCDIVAMDYVPQGAVVSVTTVEIAISCSDFNAPEERITEVVIADQNVDSFDGGPWDKCEAACGVRRTVVKDHDVSSLNGRPFGVKLAVSPAVDAYSCSESTSIFVDAHVKVSVFHYYSSNYTSSSTVKYALNSLNLQPGCRDSPSGWTDSAGYGCSDYQKFGWCNSVSCGSELWTCSQYQTNGLAANDVCCVCGAGTRHWTYVSFLLRNPSQGAQSQRPRVAVSDPSGNTLFNVTMQVAVGPADTLGTSAGSRRRLLSATSDAVSGPMTNFLINATWNVELSQQYSCCWTQIIGLTQKAVAESVVALASAINVDLLHKFPMGCSNCVGFVANVTIAAESNEAAIGFANNVQGGLISRALLTRKFQIHVTVGNVRAFDGAIDLSLTSQVSLGSQQVGARFDANFAGYPEQTGESFTLEWNTNGILRDQTMELAAAGIVVFNQSQVVKACAGYRLNYFAVLSDRIAMVASSAFDVQNGDPKKLVVSPIQSLVAASKRWPCADEASCAPTKVAAGVQHAVTATVLDDWNNTCTDVAGRIAATVVNHTAEVVLLPRAPVQSGAGTVYFQIQTANSDYMIQFAHFPVGLSATSQKFEVLAGPVSSLIVDAPAFDGNLVAGRLINPPPEVTVMDAFGNVVLEPLEVSFSLLDRPAALQGDFGVVTSVDGRASFLMRPVFAASSVRAVFSCNGVVATSTPFNVLHAEISVSEIGLLKLSKLAANAIQGEAFSVQPVVEIQDRFGNLASSFAGILRAQMQQISTGFILPTRNALIADGYARYTDLAISTSTGAFKIDFFVIGLENTNLTNAQTLQVQPEIANIVILRQPQTVLAGECVVPFFQLEFLDASHLPVDFSRTQVSVDLAVNTFKYTQFFSCGSGGCTASTTFRFFIPDGATLIDGFLNVDVIKSDYDDPDELVEEILLNGIPVGGTCNPDAAGECFSYFTCVRANDVTSLAANNLLTVSVKITASVNDNCAPRLQARATLYGSYRPLVPETETTLQVITTNGLITESTLESREIRGTTMLQVTGRTASFKDLQMPVAGFGYRLRFFIGSVAVETDRFDVLEVASRVVFITQPDAAIAGEPFQVQPLIHFLDSFDNLVTSLNTPIKLEISSKEVWNENLRVWVDVPSAVLKTSNQIEPIIVQTSSGVAKLQDLRVDVFVGRTILKVSPSDDSGLDIPEEQSAPFEVSLPVDSLDTSTIVAQAVAGNVSLGSISLKSGSATAHKSFATVGIQVLAGPGNISGTTVVSAIQGVAQFSGVVMEKSGEYLLQFKTTELPFTIIATAQIDVISDFPAAIEVLNSSLFETSSSELVTAGVPFEVKVQLLDRFGNPSIAGNMSVAAEPAGNDGQTAWQLLDGNNNDEHGMVLRNFNLGEAVFLLQINQAGQQTIRFRTALSPAASCNLQSVVHGCVGPYNSNAACGQWMMGSGALGCLQTPLCALFSLPTGDDCFSTCECSPPIRADACKACVVSVELQVFTRADRQGILKLNVEQQPGGAVNNEVMQQQPRVSVFTCPIEEICNPVDFAVLIRVQILVAQDECSIVNQPFCTDLLGTRSLLTDNTGVAQFTDLRVRAGPDGASNIVLLFEVSVDHRNATVEASPFFVDGQPNTIPSIVAPSPLLCDGIVESETIYLPVGTSWYWTFRAIDNNTAPYDDLSIDLNFSGVGIPSNSYVTENIYDSNNVLAQDSIAACGSVVTRPRQLRNRVQRSFFWNPVGWFPGFSLTYQAVEARRAGQFAGTPPAASCARTLVFRVCDRPHFVAPSPMAAQDTLVVLTHSTLEFTLVAQDRNEQDVVQIFPVDQNSIESMGVELGPQKHKKQLLLSGLTETRLNQVSREVKWYVPSGPPSSVYTLCFEATDNDYSCGPLSSETLLCVVCTTDENSMYATCVPELRAAALDTRDHHPLCGDSRITGSSEECDDGNHISGDGCSSTCTVEAGWQRSTSSPGVVNVCGDGAVVSNSYFTEVCDDGNLASGDGCSSMCTTEMGWNCLECGNRSACFPICADGLVTGFEPCDDSNTQHSDGCSANCTIEEGWQCGTKTDCTDVLNCTSQNGCVSSQNCTTVPDCTSMKAICGDFVVRGDEECDNPGQGCIDCKIVQGFLCFNQNGANCTTDCGDGIRLGEEQCDDGNLINGDGCSDSCTIENGYGCMGSPTPLDPIMGTGVIPPNWADLYPIGTASFRYTVCDEVCGDNITLGRLECEDANGDSGDGCSAQCSIEPGYLCPPSGICSPECGDGIRIAPEECDDANLDSNDGCTPSCSIEPAYQCFIGTRTFKHVTEEDSNSCLSQTQGNSFYCYDEFGFPTNSDPDRSCVNATHLCHPGLADCVSTVGWKICYLQYTSQAIVRTRNDLMDLAVQLDNLMYDSADVCTTDCGDGIRAFGEDCDDNNTVGGDGCSPTCHIEKGWYCMQGTPNVCNSICGDGLLVSRMEECDDGAWTDPEGDGCTDSCKLEPGFACPVDRLTNKSQGACFAEACGDGIWVKGELCDDGNQVNRDGCSSECTVEEGWACGPSVETEDVRLSVCEGIHGDLLLVQGEECDDGNVLDGDGCSSSGLIEEGYTCDGGICRTICGDGKRFGRETCDDGNQADNDGCSAKCLIETGWQCIQADCAGARCQLRVDGTGSYCEQCPPMRIADTRCSHPPCPIAALTADCQSWKMGEDGGWRQVSTPSSGIESEDCHPEWAHDGYCDFANNNAECDYDGGDCCASTCSCGEAGFPCFNGSYGGCGSFRDKQGDYHCLDPQGTQAPLPEIVLSNNAGVVLSSVEVTIVAADSVAVYYTLDGSEPVSESQSPRVISGQQYRNPFNVSTSVTILASATAWGLRTATSVRAITLQVEPPVFSPSAVNNQVFSSPVLISLTSPTTHATIRYSISSDGVESEEFIYSSPFALQSTSTVKARATVQGAIESATVSQEYILGIADPQILPTESAVYTTSLLVSIASPTAGVDVYYSICSGATWPGIANRTIGQIRQRQDDFCYPNCLGACAGGSKAGAVCRDENDVNTCGLQGLCRISSTQVRQCYPNEWSHDSKLYTEPFELNSTLKGTDTVVTAWSTGKGLQSSSLVTSRFQMRTAQPTLNVTIRERPPLTVAGNSDLGPFEAGGASFFFNSTTPLAKVYYTRDGSLPSLQGDPNTEVYDTQVPLPVSLTRSVTLTAIAVTADLLPSGSIQRTVSVQTPTPDVKVTVFQVPTTIAGLQGSTVVGPVIYPAPGYSGVILSSWQLHVNLETPDIASSIFYQLLPELPSFDDREPEEILSISYEQLQDQDLNSTSSTWSSYSSGQPLVIEGNTTLRVVALAPGALYSPVKIVPFFLRDACEAGTVSHYNDLMRPCSICPKNSYLRYVGTRGQCDSCPQDAPFTLSDGADSPSYCLSPCQPGSNSSTGLDDLNSNDALARCTPCAHGFYQPNIRSTECISCSVGLTTEFVGSTTIGQCFATAPISAGGFHTCGVNTDGLTKCWGYNAFGQLDVPKEMITWEESGVQRSGLFDYTWRSVSSGSFHSCGVTTSGKVLCWGQDFAGKTMVPDGIATWLSVSASSGYHHTCGLASSGVAICWGDDEYGQSSVPEGQSWTQISAGQFHSCGIMEDGNATCWGDNSYLQADVPRSGNVPWRSVSAGHYHTCGVLVDGTALCWGSDLYLATRVPPEVDSWSSISVGRFYTCAITALGDMRCWGSNQDGGLNYPTGVAKWASVSTGLFHTCGVDVSGTGYCWGRGVYGVTVVPSERWLLPGSVLQTS